MAGSAKDIDEIASVRALLAAEPRPVGWAARRARLDAVGSAYGVADDIAFAPCALDGFQGEWSLAPGSDPGKVLLFFHGGGYCSGSLDSHRSMVSEVGRAAGVRTLAIAYRLAPEQPFPAALDDALAACFFLMEQGIPARHIALGGDSAGGGIALSTLSSLRAAQRPLPGAAWLASPWVDLTMSGASMDGKDAADPLIHRAYLEELAGAYLAGSSSTEPRASPLFADLAGLPPVLVQVGSDETLLDDAVRVAGRLGAAEVAVTLEVWPHMIHAWHLWAARLEAGRRGIRSAGAFIAGHLSRAD